MVNKGDAINQESGDVTLIRQSHDLKLTAFARLMICCHVVYHTSWNDIVESQVNPSKATAIC